MKDALIFPSKNWGVLAIYSILSIFLAIFAWGAIFSLMLIFADFARNLISGLIYLVLSITIGLILSGYQITLIRSGINFDEKAPDFEWKKNLVTGVENLFISLVNYTLPTIIVIVVGCYMDIPNNVVLLGQKAISQLNNTIIAGGRGVSAVNTITLSQLNNTTLAEKYVVSALNALSPMVMYIVSSLIVIVIVAIVVFVIASILNTIAQARLASTGNFDEASNIPKVINDIKQIGIKKVIGLLILIVIVTAIIETILTSIFNCAPLLSILFIIITPYLTFFAQRSVGLLYSDIRG